MASYTRLQCSMSCAAICAVLMLGLGNASPASLLSKTATSASTSDPYVLKLDRVRGPRLLGGAEKNFYVANIQVGGPKPQELRVVFDLGSGQVVLPSVQCEDASCLKHRRYNQGISSSAIDIKASGKPVEKPTGHVPNLLQKRDRATISLGVGELGSGSLKGNLVKEKVCFESVDKRQKCVEMGIVAAKQMSNEPFSGLPHDGFVGLGLEGLSISRDFNFFRSLMAQSSGLPHQFGFYLGRGDEGGEITFGGFNKKRAASPIVWVPVANPEDGLWQVDILAIRVGDSTLSACDGKEFGCRGAVDAAAAHLSVPQPLAEGLQNALVVTPPSKDSGTTCGHAMGLDLQLVLDGTTLTLPANDYASGSMRATSGSACTPKLAHHNHPASMGPGLFVFGEALLRRYYTVYDWEKMRIGFSLTEPEEEDKKALSTHPVQQSLSPAPDTPPIFLMQLRFRPALKKVVRL